MKLVFADFMLSMHDLAVSSKTDWLKIGIMCPSGVRYLHVESCFSELYLNTRS